MIKVIGQENCPKCYLVKKKLQSQKIQFEYKDYNDLSNQEQQKYLGIAKQNNHLELPLIFDEDDKEIEI